MDWQVKYFESIEKKLESMEKKIEEALEFKNQSVGRQAVISVGTSAMISLVIALVAALIERGHIL